VDSHMLLARNETVVDYLSERLGYHKDIMHHIVLKHPPVLRVRVTKIKDILDYLLNEAGFEAHHIAQVPRILCHGLETTKARLDELQALFGYRPSTLVTLCKSKREYEKLLNALTETAERKSWFKSAKTKTA
jgi:mTERF